MAFLFGFAWPCLAADHAVILQYHHFGDDTPPSTSVTLKQFDLQLSYLLEHGYNVWPLEKIISFLKERKGLPDKCVAITIDDAYVSVYERAYPRLRKYGFPFTVFVPTGGVDKGIKSYLSWGQMREMQKYGAAFASHSSSHDYLIRRHEGEGREEWKDRVTKDIKHSLKRLKEETGRTPGLFAYPYGEYNTDLKDIINGLGLTGLGQQSGAVWSGSDFGVLPRFPMAAHYADREQFITKVQSLPLPVKSSVPDEPVLPPGVSMPLLSLTLMPGSYDPDSLACYTGGQGKIHVTWPDRDAHMLEIRAKGPLPKGRSRYNCTARHKKENRYFWYSHLWIRN